MRRDGGFGLEGERGWVCRGGGGGGGVFRKDSHGVGRKNHNSDNLNVCRVQMRCITSLLYLNRLHEIAAFPTRLAFQNGLALAWLCQYIKENGIDMYVNIYRYIYIHKIISNSV